MAMAVGVGVSDKVEDDGSRVVTGYCLEVIDECFFHGLEQGKLGAPKSRLLASAHSTVSLSHW
jgi:hypothetical protein